MLIGYARVSTQEQSLDSQLDCLQKAGVQHIYRETVSGAKAERMELMKALAYCREGDCLVVWKLDRMGRSLKHLIAMVEELEKRKIGFKSLTEQIDTTTPAGRLQFHLFASLAEFERDLIRERTIASLKAARARGRCGGRPPSLKKAQVKMLRTLAADRKNTVPDLCEQFKISKNTFYKYTRTEQTA